MLCTLMGFTWPWWASSQADRSTFCASSRWASACARSRRTSAAREASCCCVRFSCCFLSSKRASFNDWSSLLLFTTAKRAPLLKSSSLRLTCSSCSSEDLRASCWLLIAFCMLVTAASLDSIFFCNA
eukprot:Skav203794  [mRNA]  locus=scaffold206:597482:611479:- [translate_table: standard]